VFISSFNNTVEKVSGAILPKTQSIKFEAYYQTQIGRVGIFLPFPNGMLRWFHNEQT
jgi:hypothetical protein